MEITFSGEIVAEGVEAADLRLAREWHGYAVSQDGGARGIRVTVCGRAMPSDAVTTTDRLLEIYDPTVSKRDQGEDDPFWHGLGGRRCVDASENLWRTTGWGWGATVTVCHTGRAGTSDTSAALRTSGALLCQDETCDILDLTAFRDFSSEYWNWVFRRARDTGTVPVVRGSALASLPPAGCGICLGFFPATPNAPSLLGCHTSSTPALVVGPGSSPGSTWENEHYGRAVGIVAAICWQGWSDGLGDRPRGEHLRQAVINARNAQSIVPPGCPEWCEGRIPWVGATHSNQARPGGLTVPPKGPTTVYRHLVDHTDSRHPGASERE